MSAIVLAPVAAAVAAYTLPPSSNPIGVSHTRGNILARWGLLGRTKVPESPEFEAAVKLYEDAQRCFKGIAKDSEKLGDAANEHARSHYELTQMLSGIAFEKEQPAVATFVEVEKQILRDMDALAQQFHKLFIAPVEVLLQGEIRDCRFSKQQYDKAKKHMERMLRALNLFGGLGGNERSVASANAFYIAEQRYLVAKQEFLLRLQSLENKKRMVFEENMREYLEMQAQVLERNIALLESHPEMLSSVIGAPPFTNVGPLAARNPNLTAMSQTIPTVPVPATYTLQTDTTGRATPLTGSANIGFSEGLTKARWDQPNLVPTGAMQPAQIQFAPIAPAPTTAAQQQQPYPSQQQSQSPNLRRSPTSLLSTNAAEMESIRQMAAGEGFLAKAMQQTVAQATQCQPSPHTIESGVIPNDDITGSSVRYAGVSDPFSGYAASEQPIQQSLLTAGVGGLAGASAPVNVGGSVVAQSVPLTGVAYPYSNNRQASLSSAPISMPMNVSVPANLSEQQQLYVQQQIQKQIEQQLASRGYGYDMSQTTTGTIPNRTESVSTSRVVTEEIPSDISAGQQETLYEDIQTTKSSKQTSSTDAPVGVVSSIKQKISGILHPSSST